VFILVESNVAFALNTLHSQVNNDTSSDNSNNNILMEVLHLLKL